MPLQEKVLCGPMVRIELGGFNDMFSHVNQVLWLRFKQRFLFQW